MWKVIESMSIAEHLNQLEASEAHKQLEHCCASPAWVARMLTEMPFGNDQAVTDAANEAFDQLIEADWRSAFAAHPRIGDINSLREKYAATKAWASSEQSGVRSASDDILIELSELNEVYVQKFGYIFIVCATGKSASEMLDILKSRLPNAPTDEWKVAANEQRKITHLRLQKLQS